jgi:hypothetical protein
MRRRGFVGALLGFLALGTATQAQSKSNDSNELDKQTTPVPANESSLPLTRKVEVSPPCPSTDEEWISLSNVLKSSRDIHLSIKRGDYGVPVVYDKISGRKISRLTKIEIIADVPNGLRAEIEFIPEECDFSINEVKTEILGLK